jgi:hypothetical protein
VGWQILDIPYAGHERLRRFMPRLWLESAGAARLAGLRAREAVAPVAR